jgi:hypothetical protein
MLSKSKIISSKKDGKAKKKKNTKIMEKAKDGLGFQMGIGKRTSIIL